MNGDDRHPSIADVDLPEVLAALADPVRLTMVRTLVALSSSPCNDLHHAARLTISRSTFSHHQRTLRQAGVISERINGAQRILTVRAEDLESRFPGLLAVILAERSSED